MRLLFVVLAALPSAMILAATNEHPINTWQDLAYLEDFTFDFLKAGVYGDASNTEVNFCLTFFWMGRAIHTDQIQWVG